MTTDHGRRMRRSLITMSVLVAFFIGSVFVGFRLLFAEAPTLATGQDTGAECRDATIPAGGRLDASQVTVTVYNAGSVSGLANRTLINLQQRGFKPGKVGNTPEGVQPGNNVTIITPDRSAAAVRLVAAQFRAPVAYAQPTQAQGDNVEVVVGRRFSSLKKRYPRVVKVTAPTQVCVPVATPEPPA